MTKSWEQVVCPACEGDGFTTFRSLSNTGIASIVVGCPRCKGLARIVQSKEKHMPLTGFVSVVAVWAINHKAALLSIASLAVSLLVPASVQPVVYAVAGLFGVHAVASHAAGGVLDAHLKSRGL